MRIFVDIGHPAHVHLFRNAISIWEKHGHECIIIARDKDVTVEMLKHYGLDFHLVSAQREGMLRLAIELAVRVARIFWLGLRFRPDVLISVSSPASAFAAFLLRAPHVAFDDTESANFGRVLYKPFTHHIYSPATFRKDLGGKHSKYDSFHEMAYLHPNYFKANPRVLKEVGLSETEPFFVLRFVRFLATHDLQPIGFNTNIKDELISTLSKYGQIVVSSEADKSLYIYGKDDKISTLYLLDLLYYSSLYIGEGGTTATEAAVLGTPAVLLTHASSGNWVELENKYGLLSITRDPEKVLDHTKIFLEQIGDREVWYKKREKLLKDKLDLTKFIVSEIERYGKDD